MERFKDILQLTANCEITEIVDGELCRWKYIMIHPEDKKYILAINCFTHNVDSLNLFSMKKNYFFIGKRDIEFIIREKIRQKEDILKLVKRDIQALHNELKFYGIEDIKGELED